jgi:anti-sigma B factor antagonist
MAPESDLITGITEQPNGETTLSVAGEIDAATVATLATALRTAINGADVVTVDLSGVGFIDSSGIRCMLEARLEAERASVDLRVVGVQPSTMRILQIAGVEQFLHCQAITPAAPRLAIA